MEKNNKKSTHSIKVLAQQLDSNATSTVTQIN